MIAVIVQVPCFIVTIGVVVLAQLYAINPVESIIVAFQAADLIVGGSINPSISNEN